MALAANKDLRFTYEKRPGLVPVPLAGAIAEEAAAPGGGGGPWLLPLPASAAQFLARGSDDSSLLSCRLEDRY
jgi:hypothetical protein